MPGVAPMQKEKEKKSQSHECHDNEMRWMNYVDALICEQVTDRVLRKLYNLN